MQSIISAGADFIPPRTVLVPVSSTVDNIKAASVARVVPLGTVLMVTHTINAVSLSETEASVGIEKVAAEKRLT